MPANHERPPGIARTRVAIVDGMENVRRDLCRLLPLAGPIEVLADASGEWEAGRAQATAEPEVVLMALGPDDARTFGRARQMKARHPAWRVIGLATHANPERLRAARLAGMDSIFVMGEPLERLVETICRLRQEDTQEEGGTP